MHEGCVEEGASGGVVEGISRGAGAATRTDAGGGGISGLGGGDSWQTPGKGDGPRHHVRTREEVLNELRRELGPCVQGLCRLRTTYADDRRAVQKMDKIVAHLSALQVALGNTSLHASRSTYP